MNEAKIKPKYRKFLNRNMDLPTLDLKTRRITFDDRLQQVRVIHKTKNGYVGMIEFLNYRDDPGFNLMKRYRTDWFKVIRV